MLEKLFKNGDEEMLMEILYLLLLKGILIDLIIFQDTDMAITGNSIIMEDTTQDFKDPLGLEEIEEEEVEVEEEDFKFKILNLSLTYLKFMDLMN